VESDHAALSDQRRVHPIVGSHAAFGVIGVDEQKIGGIAAQVAFGKLRRSRVMRERTEGLPHPARFYCFQQVTAGYPRRYSAAPAPG